MQISMDQMKLGQLGVVTHIDTDAHLRRRLADFGVVPGTQVACRYRSPGGSVTALEFRDTVLAMRTRDMRKIRVRC